MKYLKNLEVYFIAEGMRETYVRCFKRQRKRFSKQESIWKYPESQFPHTDKQHVIKGGVAIGVLKRTGTFLPDGKQPMNTSGSKISIYACSGRSKRNICPFYREIFAVLQDQDVLAKIMKTGDKKEIIEIIKKKKSNL